MIFREKLGNLVSFKTGKLNSNAAIKDGKYPFFTCSQETYRTDTFSFNTTCVLLGGNNANGIYPLKYFSGKFDAYQRTYIIEPLNKNRLYTRYLYFAMILQLSKLRSISTGAATKFLTLTILRDIEIEFPEVKVQRRIASILSAYDDLIENNTRRIAILEEMARRIYEEWFVHFRFPGHEKVKMVDSELGKIPEGWRLKALSQVTINHDRKRKPLSQMQRAEFQGPYPYYGAAKILDYVKEYLLDGRYVLMAEDGSVITKEGFPVLQITNGRFWVNNHTHILEGTNQASTEFTYLHLSNLPISGYITGAAQPKITQENMNRIPIVLPPDNQLMIDFTRFAKFFFDLIEILARKNTNLRTTRDFLLPKLISGEIDVSRLPEPDDTAT